MTISLPDPARKQSIASIKRYFDEELDQDIGELKAGLLLEPWAPSAVCAESDAAKTEKIAVSLRDIGGARCMKGSEVREENAIPRLAYHANECRQACV